MERSSRCAPIGCCNLSLKPTRDAVCTRSGYVYDKETILKHILREKELIQESVAALEKRRRLEVVKGNDKSRREEENRRCMEYKLAQKITSSKTEASKTEKRSNLLATNHWLPGTAENIEVDVSDQKMGPLDLKPRCPKSQKPITFKKLIPVRFLFHKSVRFGEPGFVRCAATNKPILHQKCVLIRPTGQVVLKAFIEEVVKKDGGVWEGKKLKPSRDLIDIHHC
jgi:nitric oxide synthase-interacting protein